MGMSDLLPPFAAAEAEAAEQAVAVFDACGYQRVTPPLLEFEETLIGDDDLSGRTFRVTDAVSGKIMGVRADMTPQIGRIAATRLKRDPRPLRLAYAGYVVRTFPDRLHSARQVLQVGAELIGADCAKADAEIVLTAAEALERLGVKSFVFDLNLPTLFPALCAAWGWPFGTRWGKRRGIKSPFSRPCFRRSGKAAARWTFCVRCRCRTKPPPNAPV